MKRPGCYNRAPFADGNWYATGEHRASVRDSVNAAQAGKARPEWRPVLKPVLRWRPRWFTDRCATWDGTGIGPATAEHPAGTPYPVHHGYDCTGCRWRPITEEST